MKKLITTSVLGAALIAPVSFAFALDSNTTGTTSNTTTAAESQKKQEMTVEGPIAKLVAKKKEIYVQGPEKTHEFYFKPTTTLMKDGQNVDFSTLAEGMKVRVTYVMVGKRTDPVKVEVIQ